MRSDRSGETFQTMPDEKRDPPFPHAFIGTFSVLGTLTTAILVSAAIYKTGNAIIWLCVLFAVNSLLTFLAYREDKFRAQNKYWRIPEKKLHLCEFLCGWPGALCAQQICRHKNKKTSFMLVFFLCAAANIVLLYLLFHSHDPAAVRIDLGSQLRQIFPDGR